ncbi:chorismate-binding protein, partial [Stomatohabitans albus]|uniref:chorismate-binding protein n=1 Tax=Stomatohabitans albus TaxID=3110766 RepID=UPI00300C5644
MSSELLADLPATHGYALVGPHIAVAGRGVAERFRPSDPTRRFAQAAQWVNAHLGEEDLAFMSFTFDPLDPGSEIVRCAQVAEVYTNGHIDEPVVRPSTALDGDDASQFKYMVRQAVQRLTNGELEKVVLSRTIDLPAKGVTVPMFASALHDAFPMCLTYVHDQFVGASPEVLLRRRGGETTSLVLAGSAPVQDAERLRKSKKDL